MAKKNSATKRVLWNQYLKERCCSLQAIGNEHKVSNQQSHRSRKRSKPTMNLHTKLSPNGNDTIAKVQTYWKDLNVSERQQILFLDTPELVQQLYKLNLSLLCVGLMQRHLNNPQQKMRKLITNTTVLQDAKQQISAQEKLPPVANSISSSTTPSKAEIIAPKNNTKAEKTYDLLEAMEFMDIGTGILTVKNELVESPEQLFMLITNVLPGFLTSIHLLSESEFHDLFVLESDLITTWEDYERLIGMLVEQLILRNYALYLEQDATRRMEELLKEVSLEENLLSTNRYGGQNVTASVGGISSSTSNSMHKKKRRKKKLRVTASKLNIEPAIESHSTHVPITKASEISNVQTMRDISIKRESVDTEDYTISGEPEEEESTIDSEANDPTISNFSSPQYTALIKSKIPVLESSSLNPNARAFQPHESGESFRQFTSKRKHQDIIIQFSDNISHYSGYSSDDTSDMTSICDDYDIELESDLFPNKYTEQDRCLQYGLSSNPYCDIECSNSEKHAEIHYQVGLSKRDEIWQRKQLEDLELQRLLQPIYETTNNIFGWNFSQHMDTRSSPSIGFWNHENLWRTAPQEVVRYFGSFHPNTLPHHNINPSTQRHYSPYSHSMALHEFYNGQKIISGLPIPSKPPSMQSPYYPVPEQTNSMQLAPPNWLSNQHFPYQDYESRVLPAHPYHQSKNEE